MMEWRARGCSLVRTRRNVLHSGAHRVPYLHEYTWHLLAQALNRADAASYLAGDWQIDVQLYGDFQIVEPVYRGAGFLPVLGWAHDDTWLYFQNEKGISRVEIPESMQRHQTAK